MPNQRLLDCFVTLTSSRNGGIEESHLTLLSDALVSFNTDKHFIVKELGHQHDNAHIHACLTFEKPVYSQKIHKVIKQLYADKDISSTINNKTVQANKLDDFYMIAGGYCRKEQDWKLLSTKNIDPLKMEQGKLRWLKKNNVKESKSKKDGITSHLINLIDTDYSNCYVDEKFLYKLIIDNKLLSQCYGTSPYYFKSIFYSVLNHYNNDKDALENHIKKILDI